MTLLRYFFNKNKTSNNLIYKIANARAKKVVGKINSHIKKKEKVLDVGAGSCNIAETLVRKGHNVTAIDVRDISLVEDIKPTIYDGKKIPFPDNSFDTALIITVLHHTKNPEEILKEAMRVSNKIIIIEDIHTNKIHKYLTFLFDSIVNAEFLNHPHSNKNDKEWKRVFNNFKLKLSNSTYYDSIPPFKHSVYVLEK